MKYFILIIILLFNKNQSLGQRCLYIPSLLKDIIEISANQRINTLSQSNQIKNITILRSLYQRDTSLRNDINISNEIFDSTDNVNKTIVLNQFENFYGFQAFAPKYWDEVVKIESLLINHIVGSTKIFELEQKLLNAVKNNKATINDLFLFYNEYCWNIIYKQKKYSDYSIIVDRINLLKDWKSKKVLFKHLNFFKKEGYDYFYLPSNLNKQYAKLNFSILMEENLTTIHNKYYLDILLRSIQLKKYYSDNYSYLVFFPNTKKTKNYFFKSEIKCF